MFFPSLHSICEVAVRLKAQLRHAAIGVSHDWPLLSEQQTQVGIFDFKLLGDAAVINEGGRDVRPYLHVHPQ